METLVLRTALLFTVFLLCSAEEEYTDGWPFSTTTEGSCPSGFYKCRFTDDCIHNYEICDGFYDCPYGDDEENCFRTTEPPINVCQEPFELVGERCVFIDPFTDLSWHESKYMCEKLNADLISIDSLALYGSLLEFIREKDLTSHDYWIGATDEVTEGNWVWENGKQMQMGSPLWSIYCNYNDYQQEPLASEGDDKDCAFLEKIRFYYVDDDKCDQPKGAICEVPLYHSGPRANQPGDSSQQVKEEGSKNDLQD
ncbi:hepatic lectin-like [Homarus americanus]|uniref:Hepatic lectin-like 1 n=1 Tax=Homarus americanus TaxID=6706 RepID=A0A8J5J7X8_HOMAM|nr:hepatic lectin-like [Homarus americanus]KAG7153901.1 Hepatic lectin-like 1 [Homarus americanus]